MSNSIKNQILEKVKKGHRFIGVYSDSVTNLSGTTIEEAIEYFYSHYNASLSYVYDSVQGTLYLGKLNKEPDVRGRYRSSFYDGDKLVFNCNSLTRPIVKLKPRKNDGSHHSGWIDRNGQLFPCGFQAHIGLADELFLSKTVERPESASVTRSNDQVLNDMGWVKLSDRRISFTCKKLTVDQKKFIKTFMKKDDRATYEFQFDRMKVDEIIEELEEF